MRAKKALGKAVIVQVCFVLILINQANAIPVDMNIYSSTTIDSGNYGTVNIYDTPPDQTIVDMTGGSIAECHVYDNAFLDYKDGEIVYLVAHDDSTVEIHSDYDYGFVLADRSKILLYNGDSDFQAAFYSGSDDAELHFYGYDLIYTPGPSGLPGLVEGYWESNVSFNVIIRNSADVTPNVILHEIPEPLTVLLFTFGGLLLRRTRK